MSKQNDYNNSPYARGHRALDQMMRSRPLTGSGEDEIPDRVLDQWAARQRRAYEARVRVERLRSLQTRTSGSGSAA